MRKHNIHSILLSLPLLALLVASCGREGFEPGDAGEGVSFSVSENIPALREKTATKAPKVYTGATADVQALDFAVWAYNMPSAGSLPAGWLLDGGTGSTPVKASYNSEKSDWRPAGNIKYNSSGRASTWQARWFALGPWAAYNGSTANVSGLTPADGSAPRPRYTVPSGSLVSTRHYDLLAAVSADRAVGTTTPVALNFCHVLTGIRFKREKDLNITDITVSGVYDRADLVMEKIPADGDLTAFVNVDNEGDDADLWSGRTRSVATPSFSMAPSNWTNGRPGNPAAETQWDYAAGDGDIMMMIPQFTPAGATITVTIDGVPVAGDISGHRWLPGRLVTYAITRGDDFLTWELEALGEEIIWDNEYIIEGTVPATFTCPYWGGELTLATDFRSCIDDGEQTVPEPFVFQHSADGTSWTDGLPDWISPVSGINMSGATTATTLSLKATPKAKETPLSVYLRVCQPTSGKTTASCMITQQSAYLPLKFRVSQGGKQVYFSKGNLLVENKPVNGVNKRVWRFEYEQYGVSGYYPEGAESYYNIPRDPPKIYFEPHGGGYSVAGRGISHFGWATAGVKNPNGPNAENLDYGYDPHHIYYEPGSILTGNGMYTDNHYWYGPSVNGDNTWAANLNSGTVEDNSWNYGNAWNTVRPYCDWGVHFDDHGIGYDDIMEIGTNGGSWYTLSAAEWIYLLESRPNFDQLLSCAQIYIEAENRTENGLIILPDDWVLPSGCTFKPASKKVFTDNRYTTGTSATAEYSGLWSVMEAAGALFLPAAGDRLPGRDDSWGFTPRTRGNYWSSSAYDNELSYGLIFDLSDPKEVYFGMPRNGSSRCVGYSVRLVHD